MRNITLIVCFIIYCSFGFCQMNKEQFEKSVEERINLLMANMSIEEKIGQTCQITLDAVLKTDKDGKILEPLKIDEVKLNEAILKYHVGSILNVSSHTLTLSEWKLIHEKINQYYLKKHSKTPILFGIDAIHGVNYTQGATLFPHEIGLAATWNREVLKKAASITAVEMRASGIRWNFSPVLVILKLLEKILSLLQNLVNNLS